MSESIFMNAIRNKYRFQTPRGELSVEDLWDVPLRSKNDFNLDTVARMANAALQKTEESFVPTVNSDPNRKVLEEKLEIVKYVIGAKVAEEEAARLRVKNAEERRKLEMLLATKQAQMLESLEISEIESRLAALSN